jgi:WD40 repeat protein
MTDEIFLSSSSDFTIKIWNLDSTETCLQTIDCAQDEAMILRKINETTFACLSYDGLIKIFNSDKETLLFKCFKTIDRNAGNAKDLKVCSDSNLLICASKFIHLYSLSDFTFVATLRPNGFALACSMEILPNSRLIVANNNQTLEMWCLKTCQSLSIYKDHSSLFNKILFYNN